MVAQGDVAAVAGVVLVYTDVATFVELILRVTLLGAGMPLVSTGVATFHPTIFIRTVAGDLTLVIGGV